MGVCFQAPHCCTQTLTNGNTLCSLIYTSISGTCHVKTVQVIYEELQKQFNIYLNLVWKIAYIHMSPFVNLSEAELTLLHVVHRYNTSNWINAYVMSMKMSYNVQSI